MTSSVKNYSKFTIELFFNKEPEEIKNDTISKCFDIVSATIKNPFTTHVFKKNENYILIIEVDVNTFTYRTDSFNKLFKIIDPNIIIKIVTHNKNSLKEKLIELIKENWIHCEDPKILA